MGLGFAPAVSATARMGAWALAWLVLVRRQQQRVGPGAVLFFAPRPAFRTHLTAWTDRGLTADSTHSFVRHAQIISDCSAIIRTWVRIRGGVSGTCTRTAAPSITTTWSRRLQVGSSRRPSSALDQSAMFLQRVGLYSDGRRASWPAAVVIASTPAAPAAVGSISRSSGRAAPHWLSTVAMVRAMTRDRPLATMPDALELRTIRSY